jgi:hypothetical protein
MLRRTTAVAACRRTVPLLGGGGGHGEGHSHHSGKPIVFDADYKGSEKGGDVGARNEAAFIEYLPHRPESANEKYVMPDTFNLLTITPVLIAIALTSSMTWGTFLWDLYVRRHYKAIVIERPAGL